MNYKTLTMLSTVFDEKLEQAKKNYDRELESISDSFDDYSSLPSLDHLPIKEISAGGDGWPLYIYLPMKFELMKEVIELFEKEEWKHRENYDDTDVHYKSLNFHKEVGWLHSVYVRFCDATKFPELIDDPDLCVITKVGEKEITSMRDVFEATCRDGAVETW